MLCSSSEVLKHKKIIADIIFTSYVLVEWYYVLFTAVKYSYAILAIVTMYYFCCNNCNAISSNPNVVVAWKICLDIRVCYTTAYCSFKMLCMVSCHENPVWQLDNIIKINNHDLQKSKQIFGAA